MKEQEVATIKDVAKLAGVSISTASVALSGKGPVSEATLNRVREAAQKLKYRPNALARGLVTRRTRSIGLVLADLTDPYFHEVVKGIEGIVSEAGYTVVLADTDRSTAKEERSIETLLGHQVDGLILAGSGDGSEKRLAPLQHGPVPIVTVGKYDLGFPSVSVDNRGASVKLVERLVADGFRRIGYIGGPAGLLVSRERLDGFNEALAAASLEAVAYVTSDFTPHGGYDATKSILSASRTISLKEPGVDAIICANDQMAIGSLKAVRELGFQVPQDIAIAGVGDIPNATFVDPPLTTVALPLREMGERAARLLLDLIEGKGGDETSMTLDVTLKVRRSTDKNNLTKELNLMATSDQTTVPSVNDVLGRIIPKRKIDGSSAILLPFTKDGQPDYDGLADHVARTVKAGLRPAVNMDTGYVNLLNDAERQKVLETTRAVLGEDGDFIAGAFIEGKSGDPVDLYRHEIEQIRKFGGTPIIFQCSAMKELSATELVGLYEKVAKDGGPLYAFELGEMFAPFGAIWSDDVAQGIMEIPEVLGYKHSSLDRQIEWRRLELKKRIRPDFKILTGNDLAIDMVVYGSDYLLGLSTFAPETFAYRDRLWEAGDSRFYQVNDVLQYLGEFAFRHPTPAYKHSAAQFLNLRGWIQTDLSHPDGQTRPDSDREILQLIVDRIESLGIGPDGNLA